MQVVTQSHLCESCGLISGRRALPTVHACSSHAAVQPTQPHSWQRSRRNGPGLGSDSVATLSLSVRPCGSRCTATVGLRLPLQRQRQAQRGRLSSSKTDNSSTHIPGSDTSTDESTTSAEASLQHTSSQGTGTPQHHNSSTGSTSSKSTAAAETAQADVDDTAKGLFAEDSFEDDYGSEEEDEDELEDSDDDYSSGDQDNREADRVLEAVLNEKTVSASVLELAASMAAVGLQGTAAIGLGYLINHNSLLDSFRWSAADVETGLLWALPAIIFGTLISALPLPTHAQLMTQAGAAAAAAAGSSATGSSSSRQEDQPAFDSFSDARRMATVSALVADMPTRVNIGIGSGGGAADDRLLTSLTPSTALQALRYMQEYVAEPWSIKTNSTQSWALRAGSGVLRRLGTELLWRGLLVAGLAGWLYSTWQTAGTNQDSPLFYARLFGLLTPQASLAVISGILLASRIPADLARLQPAMLYTRLASMEVEVVGRLTEDDWLVMAIPAESAAAAAATAPAVDNTTASKVVDVANKRLNMQEALTEKVQFFGRVKAAREAAASSSSSSGQGSSQPQQQRQQQQQLSKQEMEQQLDKLLAAVQDWKAALTSSSSSSGSSARILPAAFRLTPREQEAAELAAEFLELVKASAAAKAAAAVATKSKYIAKSAGLPSSKLVSGLESLLLQLNKDPQRRLFLLHIATDDISSSGSSGSRGDGSSSEEDESSSDEDEDESTPGSVQAMMKAKARTAAEGVRQREAARTARAESAAAADKQQQQQVDEAVGSGVTPRSSLQAEQRGAADAAGSGSTNSNSEKGRQTNSDSSGEQEGMTLSELMKIIKEHHKELATPDGQQSDFALYLKASKGAFKVAATIPTAQDRVAEVLLLSFSLLEQLATAGAFVASCGNLAASFTAAAAVQVATTTLQQVVGQRERQRIREGIGRGWALQLNLLQPE